VRIFVIGATGFVGGNVARSFAAAGHAVQGLARTQMSATSCWAKG
jgi:nucleoside-diphosphate-sugar epimerase